MLNVVCTRSQIYNYSTTTINIMIYLRFIRNNMSTLELVKPVTSGDKFLVTGWYKYVDHVDSNTTDCFVPMQSCRMFFKKDEVAPLLGSCEHAIRWELISAY